MHLQCPALLLDDQMRDVVLDSRGAQPQASQALDGPLSQLNYCRVHCRAHATACQGGLQKDGPAHLMAQACTWFSPSLLNRLVYGLPDQSNGLAD